MGAMVGPKRHRQSRPEVKRGEAGQRLRPGNSPEDAKVEAEQRASGVLKEEEPKGITEAEARKQRVVQDIAADIGLQYRPQERWLVEFMSLSRLRKLDGSAVMVNGKALDTTMKEALVTEIMLAAINQADPHQQECRELLWYSLFGRPRQGFELSGPAGGPIETSGKLEMPSEQEMAERLRRAIDVTRKVIDAQASPSQDGIEVSASTKHDGTPLPATNGGVTGLDVVVDPPASAAAQVVAKIMAPPPAPAPAPPPVGGPPVAPVPGHKQVGAIPVVR